MEKNSRLVRTRATTAPTEVLPGMACCSLLVFFGGAADSCAHQLFVDGLVRVAVFLCWFRHAIVNTYRAPKFWVLLRACVWAE